MNGEYSMETQAYQPKLDDAKLIILENGEIKSISLEKQSQWRFGRRTKDNIPDIPLNSPIAGRKHGEFICIGGQWFYCDGGSRNGTFYNGKKVSSGLNGRVNPVLLRDGDILRIDYSDLATPDPRGVWLLFTTTRAAGEWKYILLDKDREVTIGRYEKCDIVQPMPYISSHHAKIIYDNNCYRVFDCNSSAGTWLNGKKVENSAVLKEKDRISICDCHFIYSAGGLIYNYRNNVNAQTRNGDILLRADIKSKKVYSQDEHKYKELISNIKLEVRSGQLIALLGSSGAGKSTLLNCLNGTEQNGVEGEVLFQGEDLYKNYERIKYFIGNVTQNNILHETLTVENELTDAAQLRLPGDTKKAEIEKLVNNTIDALNLTSKRRTQIKKLSGGEQKRVHIGVELVADRKLFCLDEPDAGLDPPYKIELFTILKNLVKDKGKSIIAIIHDVSEIDLFDQIIMMKKTDGVGRIEYMGTPEHAREYFHVDKLSEMYK